MQNRRTFMKSAALAAAAISAGQVVNAKDSGSNPLAQEQEARELFFDISLAQWSLNRKFRGKEKEMENLDFPAYTKDNFDIHAVEYVDQFFPSADKEYIKGLLKRTEDIGVKNVLLMIDTAGALGDQDEEKRKLAVEKHYQWVEAAEILGCHSIRVNARGRGSDLDVAHSTTKSLITLSQFAADYGISVIVENHGGPSSRASWLTSVIRNTGMVNCGVLPDFGNFIIDRKPGGEKYDLYQGMKELMPLAKGVSAKSHDFDEEGNETTKDFYRLLKIVKDSGFRGYVGIEYEGGDLSQDEGILATKNLLIKAGKSLM
ncbi:MAG: sugar phosphate isomerase/epimerase [Bacteroidales bacterium]|nr:sugar phosphate isomerase/epimerase [Bacteroidales bacterium]